MATSTDFIDYLNLAREQPGYYVSLIEQQMAQFVNEFNLPLLSADGRTSLHETFEGLNAWKEARNFLMRQKPLLPLQAHQGLNQSSEDHAYDMSVNGAIGHTGTDNSNLGTRLGKYCFRTPALISELIGLDFICPDRNSAEMTALNLIIDDGSIDRSHRGIIFDPRFRYVGCKVVTSKGKFLSVFNLSQDNLILRDCCDQTAVMAGIHSNRGRVAALAPTQYEDTEQYGINYPLIHDEGMIKPNKREFGNELSPSSLYQSRETTDLYSTVSLLNQETIQLAKKDEDSSRSTQANSRYTSFNKENSYISQQQPSKRAYNPPTTSYYDQGEVYEEEMQQENLVFKMHHNSGSSSSSGSYLSPSISSCLYPFVPSQYEFQVNRSRLEPAEMSEITSREEDTTIYREGRQLVINKRIKNYLSSGEIEEYVQRSFLRD